MTYQTAVLIFFPQKTYYHLERSLKNYTILTGVRGNLYFDRFLLGTLTLTLTLTLYDTFCLKIYNQTTEMTENTKLTGIYQ